MNEDIYHLGVKALIRNATGKILLLEVNTAAYTLRKDEPHWDIPGGRIEKNSTIEKTLQREVQEELGNVTLEVTDPLLTVISNIRIPLKDKTDVGLVLSVYACKLNEPSVITLSDEHLSYGWFDPKEAAEKLAYKYPQQFIAAIKQL
jgi:8-oxo-dGTP pyrophosphatase MutT (NUDIX family)